MNATVTVTKRKSKARRHRGVVAVFIDDVFPPGWADWLEVPAWPETMEDAPLCGLGARRWRHLADYAKTLQEQQVARQLGEYSSVAEVAVAMGLSVKRVQQIGRGLLDRVAKPRTAPRQVDMFDDEDDGGASS